MLEEMYEITVSRSTVVWHQETRTVMNEMADRRTIRIILTGSQLLWVPVDEM